MAATSWHQAGMEVVGHLMLGHSNWSVRGAPILLSRPINLQAQC